MHADGSNAMQVSSFGPKGGWGIQPSWTPDGSHIMFVAEDIARTHPTVGTLQPDGGGLRRLDRRLLPHASAPSAHALIAEAVTNAEVTSAPDAGTIVALNVALEGGPTR